MRQHWDRREGILLQAMAYLENRRILKIFTKDAGLLSIMANSKKAPFATPFCRAEWVYRISSGELQPLKEVSLIDPMLGLKESFERIEAAGSIARDLLRSQLPHKASQGLYELLLASYTHLGLNPKAISQSFRLKLLQFEGLLYLQQTCMYCKNLASHLSRGESVCATHSEDPRSEYFTPPEWKLLLTLGKARRYSELTEIEILPAFTQKSTNIFLYAMK